MTLRTSPPKNRFALYAGLNVAFFLVVAICYGLGDSQNPRILYLLLIFALCSTPVIDLDGFNGRQALLGIFLVTYFVMYGVGDLGGLLDGASMEASKAPLSATELVILVGGAVLTLSYRWVVSLGQPSARNSEPRDWPIRSILLVGLVMWIIGTYATYQWYVYIVTDTTNEAVRKGLQSQTSYSISAYILAQMMQPVGILLIAYAWRRSRLPYLLPAVLGIVLVQVALGFVADIKGMAMLGGILVIMTIVLVDARIPKWWLVGAVAYALLVIPVFQAYRTEIHGNRGISRAAVVANFGKILDLALSATDRVNTGRHRAQTFLERSSLRPSVQMIVDRTGKGVAYQGGYTLTPLIATFIPKIVWSDKPDVPTGQIVNKEFHVAEGEDVYISPSHLGELYWNFGWPGVVLGMATIGGILGAVGRFNLGGGKTITRLLVTVVTIKQAVIGFEGVIAASYVVWFRSLAGIGILHLVFAKVPAGSLASADEASDNAPIPAPVPGVSIDAKPFPNLLS